MTIGTPTSLGSVNTPTNTSQVTISTTAAIVAHNLVVVAIYYVGGNSISSVSDGTNVYTQLLAHNNLEFWYCVGASAVMAGASLVIMTGGGTDAHITATAAQVSGAGVADSAAMNYGSNFGTNISVVSSTLATTTEVVFGASGCATTLSFTESSGFTNLVHLSATNASICLGYKIVSSTSAVTYSPTLTSSNVTIAGEIVPFKAAALSTAIGFNMPMLGF